MTPSIPRPPPCPLPAVCVIVPLTRPVRRYETILCRMAERGLRGMTVGMISFSGSGFGGLIAPGLGFGLADE